MKKAVSDWGAGYLVFSVLMLLTAAAYSNPIINFDQHTVDMIPSSFCLAPGTSLTVANAAKSRRLFNQLAHSLSIQTTSSLNKAQFEDTNRWTQTATDGSGLQQGDPITLTWSIVPDGTSIYGYSGESSSASNLRAFLDGIYGSEAKWLPLFEEVFRLWGDLTGITYVYEPNDDGDPWLSNHIASGKLGVRGDVRIAGHHIDGSHGVLAYNFFPNYGDMVIDADDSFYNDTSYNSRGLRNVLSHEHGHGLGIQHTCPINQTKLMEPFLTMAIDGPQHDDILAAQRGYGDFFEHNDKTNTATDIGLLKTGNSAGLPELSIDSSQDVDVYSITLEADARLKITVTPIGSTYYNGAQQGDGSCSAGELMNSLNIQDLWFEILDTDGTTVLASVNQNGPGLQETLQGMALKNGAGTYFIRIKGDGIEQVQLYDLNINALGGVTNTPNTSENGAGIFGSGFD